MRLTIIGFLVSFLMIFPGCQIEVDENEPHGSSMTSPVASTENESPVTTTARNEEKREEALPHIKKYFELRDIQPDAALQEFTIFANIYFNNHPLAEEWAEIMVRSDLAGEITLIDKIRATEIELKIAKDRNRPKEQINPLEFELNVLKKDLAQVRAGNKEVRFEFEFTPPNEED